MVLRCSFLPDFIRGREKGISSKGFDPGLKFLKVCHGEQRNSPTAFNLFGHRGIPRCIVCANEPNRDCIYPICSLSIRLLIAISIRLVRQCCIIPLSLTSRSVARGVNRSCEIQVHRVNRKLSTSRDKRVAARHKFAR